MKWFIVRQLVILVIGLAMWFGSTAGARYYIKNHIHAPQNGIVIVDPMTAHPSGHQNGSTLYPFTTITAALDYARDSSAQKNKNKKQTDEQVTLLVTPGTYEELLSVPDNTSVFSASSVEKVRITPPESANGGSDSDLITLHNNTTLYNIATIGGENGIVITPGVGAHLFYVDATDASGFNIFMDRARNGSEEDPYKTASNKAKKKKNETPEEKVARGKLYDKLFDLDETLDKNNKIRTDALMKHFDDTKKVIMSHIYVARGGRQNIYLKEGWVEISDALVEESQQEGIDLHARMYVTIDDSIIRNNVENGIEGKIDRVFITIRNTTIENNASSGLNFQTDEGLGRIILENVTSSNNEEFGMRCANHKKKPSRPRPFFPTIIDSAGLTSLGNGNDTDTDNNCLR